MAQTVFTFHPQGPGLTDFTAEAAAWVRATTGGEALLTLFVRHTSCSLLIQENADPSVRTDLQTWLSRIAPRADTPEGRWITHRDEGPDDMPAHLRAALLPTSLQIPVANGRLRLGTWQGLYLVEHRDRPHRREVVAHLA